MKPASTTPRVLTEDSSLAARLKEVCLALELHRPSEVGDPGGCQSEVVFVDIDLPGLSQEMLGRLRRTSYLVAVMGWWDVREAEVRPLVDYIVNQPFRSWQLPALREDAAFCRDNSPVQVA